MNADYLNQLLHQGELPPATIAIALAVAFVLGAAHALTPGHGKTLVAAYLVGSRGTFKHAAFLGAMVTFTHTVSVFLLGLATMFLFQYVVPGKVVQVLGAVSGVSIVAIGAWMLYKRVRHAHHHHHHHHDHSHTHVPDELTWGGLIALGASGGLVPCESALVLLLSAIALHRAAFGLALLVSFSLGLAIVLMAIGMLVLYAKNLLPKRTVEHPAFRWVQVASAVVVLCIGVLMTAVSLSG